MKVEIIDLRTQIDRKRYDLQNGMAIKERFHKFADAHSEVLLVGKVPPECLTLTWRASYSDESSSDYELIMFLFYFPWRCATAFLYLVAKLIPIAMDCCVSLNVNNVLRWH